MKTKLARLDELNILLNMDKRENEIVGGEPDEGEVPLVRQSIETVFSPEEIIALYENDDLAGGAWTVWNDIGCPVDKILIIIAKLSINEPIQKAVADLLM